ncbi:MAG: tRNA lysidine(34) synthetase TilS [Myxococcales bacterium]|nr:MAG: tRNA lysidine(34) synthetase TilS [Myxococcales bacterium]
MARSHPPSLTTVVRRTLEEECGELAGRSVLAAVSGGGDSQAMLSVLARLAPSFRFELRAHGVDHGLRSEASRELDLAQALAERLQVPFARTTVALEGGGNLQARAREARYAALREAAAPHDALIATAHHATDRAETVLLRLLRGAGPRGLAVLAPRAHDVIRPLVRASKRDVLLHLERHHLEFAEDPSNADAAFLRVRVRREALPLLQELSPRIVQHLNTLADALAGADLPDLGDYEVQTGGTELNGAQIREVLRASRLGRSVTIRVAGGRDLVVRGAGRARELDSAGRAITGRAVESNQGSPKRPPKIKA